MNNNIEYLLNPGSIAFIGASNNPGRIGGMPIELLTKFNYKGDIYPVNPKYKEVFGLKCWPDIESIPNNIDLAVLAIGAKDVQPMLERCHKHGVKAAIIYAAGFAEEGSREAIELQDRLTEFAKHSGMAIAGPNCMGLANLNTQAHTAFASVFKTAPMQSGSGRVSLLTQSGNVCAAVYALLRRLNIPVSHFINTGNEACVNFSDYLNYLANDENTEVVIGYIEQIRDGAGFIKACNTLRNKNKVLIALKAGATSKGAVAVQSHTSALAGDSNIYSAAFRQLGVIEADDFAQMANLAMLAELRDRTAGVKTAVVTMSGALGAILADKFTLAGLELPDLSDAVQSTLRKGIPSYGMVSNPVDVTGNVVNDPEFVTDVLESLATSPDLDVVVIYAPGYMLDRMSDSIVDVATRHKRLFVAIDTGAAKCREQLASAGVAVFDDIGRASEALGPFLQWQEDRKLAISTEKQSSKRQYIQLEQPIDEVKALRYLSSFGVPVMADHVAHNADEAVSLASKTGFPVVMKIVSPDIAHKTEINGVKLGLSSAKEVEDAYKQIINNVRDKQPSARIYGVLVQPMQKGIAELIAGITTDPVFGRVLTVGLGGTLTEIYKDTAHAVLPVSRSQIKKLLQTLKAYPILDGFRGSPKADIDALCDAIYAICTAAENAPDQVTELEVNPLLAKASGAMALDALVITKP